MVRFIKKDEIGILVELCEKHAHFEKSDYSRGGKKERLTNALFGERPKLHCLVAIEKNEVVGYATYMLQYSTWDARYYTYLDCLYLNESARGKGLGTELMQRVKEESRKSGCDLVQWQTPDFNENAIRFYNKLGATSKSKERFFWDVSEQ